MFPPAKLTHTQSIIQANTAPTMTHPLRLRCGTHHQVHGLISLGIGPGARRATAIAPANTAAATTRPVRWLYLGHRQDQEVIWLKAGRGSGRESRSVQVRTTPRDRPTPQRGHPVMGAHRRRIIRQPLTNREHRSMHCLHLFRHQPIPAAGSNPGRSAPAATKPARSKH